MLIKMTIQGWYIYNYPKLVQFLPKGCHCKRKVISNTPYFLAANCPSSSCQIPSNSSKCQDAFKQCRRTSSDFVLTGGSMDSSWWMIQVALDDSEWRRLNHRPQVFPKRKCCILMARQHIFFGTTVLRSTRKSWYLGSTIRPANLLDGKKMTCNW